MCRENLILVSNQGWVFFPSSCALSCLCSTWWCLLLIPQGTHSHPPPRSHCLKIILMYHQHNSTQFSSSPPGHFMFFLALPYFWVEQNPHSLHFFLPLCEVKKHSKPTFLGWSSIPAWSFIYLKGHWMRMRKSKFAPPSCFTGNRSQNSTSYSAKPLQCI